MAATYTPRGEALWGRRPAIGINIGVGIVVTASPVEIADCGCAGRSGVQDPLGGAGRAAPGPAAVWVPVEPDCVPVTAVRVGAVRFVVRRSRGRGALHGEGEWSISARWDVAASRDNDVSTTHWRRRLRRRRRQGRRGRRGWRRRWRQLRRRRRRRWREGVDLHLREAEGPRATWQPYHHVLCPNWLAQPPCARITPCARIITHSARQLCQLALAQQRANRTLRRSQLHG